MRAREHGIAIGDGTPRALNAITDVPGLRVGHRTLIDGSGPLVPGRGPVRTGVTVVLPPGDVWRRPVLAGAHRLNGNGEMIGLEWVRECGMLTTPVGLTSTHSVGTGRDGLIADMIGSSTAPEGELGWSLPVVAETWTGCSTTSTASACGPSTSNRRSPQRWRRARSAPERG